MCGLVIVATYSNSRTVAERMAADLVAGAVAEVET